MPKNQASQQTCVCGALMTDDICSDPGCRYNVAQITKYEQAAMEAISAKLTMGEMLRALPASTPNEELEKYAKAYDALRRS